MQKLMTYPHIVEKNQSELLLSYIGMFRMRKAEKNSKKNFICALPDRLTQMKKTKKKEFLILPFKN